MEEKEPPFYFRYGDNEDGESITISVKEYSYNGNDQVRYSPILIV